MEKEWFEKEIDKIEVPQEEVFQAISNGREKGRLQAKQNRKKKLWKLGGAASTIAASLLLIAGLLFAPINVVLANVPLLGGIYDSVGTTIGIGLYKEDAITKRNQVATNNGVDVTITSAYYDGNVIGLTFKAEGDQLSIEHMDEGKRPVGGISYHLFDGKDQNQWESGSSGLKEVNGTLVGSIEFYRHDASLSDDFTLPLTFTHIADVNGEWAFNLPLKRTHAKTMAVNESSSTMNGDYDVTITSLTKGKATTMLEYTYTVQSKNDSISLFIKDNLGNRLGKRGAEVLKVEEKGERVQKTVRETFPHEINEQADSLIINADVDLSEPYGFNSLDQAPPFTVTSSRFGYQISVTDVEEQNGKAHIEFSINQLDSHEIRKDILQNFARFVNLLPTKNLKLDEEGELNYYSEDLREHLIKSGHVKTLNDEATKYLATYDLKDTTTLNHYTVVIPFRTLSTNDDIVHMKPLKIDVHE